MSASITLDPDRTTRLRGERQNPQAGIIYTLHAAGPAGQAMLQAVWRDDGHAWRVESAFIACPLAPRELAGRLGIAEQEAAQLLEKAAQLCAQQFQREHPQPQLRVVA